jgi:iron(III) transport system substrate-binding protein
VPASLRDPDGHWYALSMRARVIYASNDRVEENEMTYEALADPKWKGRVCIRSGQHPYNTSLFAAMVAKDGLEQTEKYLAGLRDNLARTAGGGDRDVARDILADICDVGIANSYYIGLMRSGTGGPEQEQWGNGVKVILPTFADGAGTHVNISGAVVAKHAPHKDNAIRLMEFLVSPEAQAIYARGNFEYPVTPGAEVDPIIAELGELKIDPLPLVEIAKHRSDASELVDKVGFDEQM